ncbi:hypothetical protein BGX28_009043, partial [Mortierella sp. GBA30]
YGRIPGGFAAGTGGWNEREWGVTGGVTAQFFSERKRSHTTQSASTLPSINPTLIMNAAAALSNLQGSNTSSSDESRGEGSSSDDAGYHRSDSSCSSGPISLPIVLKEKKRPAHYRNSSPVSGSLLGDRESRPLSRTSSIGLRASMTKSFHAQEYQPADQEQWGLPRQRTSTEPGQNRIRSMISQRSSQQMFRDFIHRSKATTPEAVSDAAFPENASVNDHDSALELEPACQALLKSSTSGSSAAPLYSGYVWLYVPNSMSSAPSTKSDTASLADDASPWRVSIPPQTKTDSMSSMSMLPSAMLPSGKAPNISMSRASGRYVKCFASINDKGQFQWVEVKTEGGDAAGAQGSSQTMYGFQLKSPSSLPSTEDRRATDGYSAENSTLEQKPTRVVQASMAQKLRLYFFCIKISPSSLAEVKVEITETPSLAEPSAIEQKCIAPTPKPQHSQIAGPASVRSSPSPPPLSKKSSRRVRNRFSAPVEPIPSSCLPLSSSNCSASLALLPSETMALHKSRASSGAQVVRSQSLSKSSHSSAPKWPSMSGLHDRCHSESRSSSPQLQQQLQAVESERPVRKAPSMIPPPIPPRPILVPPVRGGHHSKSKSLFAENWTKTRSAPPGSILPSVANDITLGPKPQEMVTCVAGKVVVVPKAPNTEQQSSVEGKALYSEPLPMGSSSASNVVSLAQDLKKAMRRVSGTAVEDEAASMSTKETTSAHSSSLQKPSLSEITAKKRASIQQQSNQQPQPYQQYKHPEPRARSRTSLERERSRLKLVGGLSALHEACECDEGQVVDEEYNISAEQKDRRRERTTSGGAASVAAMLRMLLQCPFLEQSEGQDAEGRMFVTLKGYTETEDGWKVLQNALERFIDGPIKDQKSALPPVDTLIPSYHAPRRPESRHFERVEMLSSTKEKNAVATAAAKALLGAEVLCGSTSSSGYATPTFTTGGASLSRSSSVSRSSTPIGFTRHSVQLATGTGYGPGKSFNDLGNSSSAGNSLATSPAALSSYANRVNVNADTNNNSSICFDSQSVSAGATRVLRMESEVDGPLMARLQCLRQVQLLRPDILFLESHLDIGDLAAVG